MATGTNFFATLMILCVLNVILMPKTTYAAPPHLLSRQRRVSDQRLAEIETLLGLLKMKGKLVKVPIAFGLLDPKKMFRNLRNRTLVKHRLYCLYVLANSPSNKKNVNF
ncbi:uncharacterized protein LOC122528940 isoform X2 [Frieseomelitta varia]|uniref:uncharacterized protein LOC122528940 isoform X2 n=1 Tax=Frieseomelitta varia TaxID=561572 RepID=UPI001CB69ABC|nr:uncharacterized protein LOC122528940 isoform X2 [Frieseomelitta varia]